MSKKQLFFLIFFFCSSVVPADAEGVLFDLSHRVIFHPLSDAPLGLKRFAALFEEKEVKVTVSDGSLTAEILGKYDTLVLPGSMTPYSKGEIEMVRDFVQKGGNLLVLLHIAPPLFEMTKPFGIILSSAVMSEEENLIEKSSQDFYAKAITPHSLTAGVKSIALYGTWGLLAEREAKTLAFTSEKAFGDFNRNRRYDSGEPRTRAGILTVADYGKGKVVVLADDAPFANHFLDMGDNLRLARNLVDWFSK